MWRKSTVEDYAASTSYKKAVEGTENKFQTYSDIQKLSICNLNGFCATFGIDMMSPKSAKVNAASHCLGPSTAGRS